jgi:hypothetical protein
VGRDKVKEEKQRSSAGGDCDGLEQAGVESEGEVYEEGKGMFQEGKSGGGAQAIDLRHVTL